MKKKLKQYINENLKTTKTGLFSKIKCAFFVEEYVDVKPKQQDPYYKDKTVFIDDFINENKEEHTKFQTLLFKHIDNKNLTDPEVYNKVHIDRRQFSKIRCDSNYHPSKDTVILLALALELTEKELEELLESAAYSLPKNNHYDLIIRFCFINKIYKLTEVNDLLNEYNCKLFNY